MAGKVMIYVMGGDSRLRSIGWDLLSEDLVTHADRIDCGALYLKGESRSRKISHGGVALMLTTSADKLDKTMTRLRQLIAGDEIRAYALPVLDVIE